MQFLTFIGNLLLFLVSLTVLVSLHELGHLSAAKLFKVYCYEYSIGMGKSLYSHKKKGGETVFSVRMLPIGGYVAMAGDEDAEEERTIGEVKAVPKERTLEGVSCWKKLIIFAAGVAVNFLLGFIFFFCSNVFCAQNNFDESKIKVTKDSTLISETIKAGDVLEVASFSQTVNIGGTDYVITAEDGTTVVTPEDYYELNEFVSLSSLEKYLPKNLSDKRTVTITLVDGTVITKTVGAEELATDDKTGVTTYKWETIGFTISTHYYGFARGVAEAGKDWCNGTVAIFKAIGGLFTPQGWSEAGGVIAMFQVSSMAAASGPAVFLNYWGLISVNLAIFNLIPIPGLDGWQLLVAAIEGTTRKKIPNKVKTIATYIGLGLVFALMAVLLVKDIFFPIVG